MSARSFTFFSKWFRIIELFFESELMELDTPVSPGSLRYSWEHMIEDAICEDGSPSGSTKEIISEYIKENYEFESLKNFDRRFNVALAR